MDYYQYGSLIADHSGTICYVSDAKTYELLYLSKSGFEACGISSIDDFQGKKCHKVLQDLDEPCPFCTNSRLTEGQEYRWQHYNEKMGRWFDSSDSLMHIEGRLCRLEIARDITAQKENMRQFERMTMEDILFRCLHTLTREKDMNTAVNQFLEVIGGYYQAERAYIFENDAEQQVIHNTFEWCARGVSPRIDELKNIPLERVKVWHQKFGSDGEFFVPALEDALDVHDPLYLDLKADGIHSLLIAPLLRDGEIVGLIGVNNPRQKEGDLILLRSVSDFVQAELERRRLISELEYLSYIDALTGLKNRNQYARVLKDFDRKLPSTLGVITLDINGLKNINETHGQAYGDYVLEETGKILQEVLPNAVFRTSGDEFVALCVDMTRDTFQECVIALRAGFDANRDFNVSIGCSWDDGEFDVNSLSQQADELRYGEKQSYYHSVLSEGRTTVRSGFVGEVLQEIADDRFLVFYQPQVDIKTGKIIGAEALVRKKADDGSLINPGKFVPFYEVGGVIGHVDLYVLRTACATIRQWLEKGLSFHLSVNFSRITLLEPDIVEKISTICAENHVPSSLITIEVTESISKIEHGRLQELIEKLTSAGFAISLDDFGSQYSNLAILAAMDFDEIKFDRTLVSTLEENQKSRIVLENSVRLCHSLHGTSSLAEGIETKGQLGLLRDYGCDYGQGYYFSKPVPLNEFNVLLQKHLLA